MTVEVNVHLFGYTSLAVLWRLWRFVTDNYLLQGEEENRENAITAALKEEDMEEIDQKDDGYIELVLRVLARMCDGQHTGLQDYLREQPDNMKSFNIVAETAQFVSLVYSNINAQNIELVMQLYETLNEFTVVSINTFGASGQSFAAVYIQPPFPENCCSVEL